MQSTRTEINRINGMEEPFIDRWTIFGYRFLSFLILLFFIGLSTMNVILMMYLRLKLFNVFRSIQSQLFKQNSFIIVSTIVSTISLVISVILDFTFGYTAVRMTELER